MHRLVLKNLLENYAPFDVNEELNLQRTLAFVREHSDCFERTCLPGHVTGSAWLLNRDGTHVLLTHHRKLNMWLQLGGHCDGQADVLDVSIREAQEESGIHNIEPVMNNIFDVDIHLIPERPGEAAHYHYDINFLLRVKDNSSFAVSEESHDLKWFAWDETLFPFSGPSMKRMFHKWGKKFELNKKRANLVP